MVLGGYLLFGYLDPESRADVDFTQLCLQVLQNAPVDMKPQG